MSPRITLTPVDGADFKDAFADDLKAMQQACKNAITAAAEVVKREGRASIAAAGFSKRWQNALRVNVYPSGAKASINAAAWVFHKIPYADIFETGGVIRPKSAKYLWLPTRNAPISIVNRRPTPAAFVASLGPLTFAINKRTGTPMLLSERLVRTRHTRGKSGRKRSRIRVSKQNPFEGRVVMFVGVRSVTEQKKFAITEICARARDKLPDLYAAEIEKVIA